MNEKSVFTVLVLSVVVAFLMSGCATLFSGGSTDVMVDSEPENASVYMDGIKRGRKTPSRITLDHSYSDVWNDKRVTVRLDEYEDRTFKIDHGISGWYWANALVTVGGAVAAYLTIGGTGTTERYDDFESASDDAETYLIFSAVSSAGAIGSIIDLVTGSWVSVDKTRYRVELREGMSDVSSEKELSNPNYLHVSLAELEKDEEGHYLVPDHEKPLIVYDTESRNRIIFQSN